MVSYRTLAIIGVLLCAVTAFLIYFTPLKHVALGEPPMHEIDPAAFYKLYQAHKDEYVVVDVRTVDKYVTGHVAGSVNMPIATLADQWQQLPKQGKEIVLVCGDGRLAKVAYGYLEDYGYLNLLHVDGGMNKWVSENLPVEQGNGATSTPAVSEGE